MKKIVLKLIVCCLIIALAIPFAMVFSACKKQSTEETGDDGTQDGSIPVNVAVLADIHLIADELIESPDCKGWDDFSYLYNIKHASYISEAILKTSVDRIIASGVKAAIIMGDLTEDGSELSNVAIAEQCKKLTDAGIAVFTANGLNDVANTKKAYSFTSEGQTEVEVSTKEQYLSTIGNYGYNNADFKDANSLSYMSAIPGGDYNVIVFDTASNFASAKNDPRALYNSTAPTLKDALLTWLESSLQECQKRGRTPVFVSYFPLTKETMTYFGKATSGIYYVLDRGEEVLNLLADYDVTTVFSAHAQAENKHVHKVGEKTITEYTTSSLATYPSFTKYCKVYKTACVANNVALDKVDASYVSASVGADVLAECTTDLASFTKKVFGERFPLQTGKNIKDRNSKTTGVMDTLVLLKLYDKDADPNDAETQRQNEICEAIDSEMTSVMRAINGTPIYGSDSNSVESVCGEFDITLPESEFHCTIYEMILKLIYKMFDGTYVYQKGDTTMQVLTDVFLVSCRMICEKQFLHMFHEMNSVIRDADMMKVSDKQMETGIFDLKEDNVILGFASIMFPYLQSIKLDTILAPLFAMTDPQPLLDAFQIISSSLIQIIPNFRFFTDDKGQFETSYVKVSKGELYSKEFAEDCMIDIIVRTAVLY